MSHFDRGHPGQMKKRSAVELLKIFHSTFFWDQGWVICGMEECVFWHPKYIVCCCVIRHTNPDRLFPDVYFISVFKVNMIKSPFMYVIWTTFRGHFVPQNIVLKSERKIYLSFEASLRLKLASKEVCFYLTWLNPLPNSWMVSQLIKETVGLYQHYLSRREAHRFLVLWCLYREGKKANNDKKRK